MKRLALAALLIPQFTFAAEACEKDFDAFLNAISESREIQEKFISYPLKYVTHKVMADPTEELASEQAIKSAKLPAFPTKSIQKSEGFSQEITDRTETSATVSLGVPETDYVLDYKFQLKSGCWLLVESHSFGL